MPSRIKRNDDLFIEGAYFGLPNHMLRHDNFRRLNAFSNKLILDLGRQYTGSNNGYQCLSWVLMKKDNWNSPSTLDLARRELLHYGFIFLSRQGGRNKPSLYGFTWRKIDEKRNKPLDYGPTNRASHAWKDERPPFVWGADRRRQKKAVANAPEKVLLRVA